MLSVILINFIEVTLRRGRFPVDLLFIFRTAVLGWCDLSNMTLTKLAIETGAPYS